MLLLDEPLGAINLKLRKTMQLEFTRAQPLPFGITFVYVTHDQDEAITMSDRIAVMGQGRIEQLGAPEEVYENPGPSSSPGSSASRTCSRGRSWRSTTARPRCRSPAGPVVKVPVSTRIPSDAGSALFKVEVQTDKFTITTGERDPGPALNHIFGGTVAMTTYIGVSHQYKVATQDGTVLTAYVQNLGVEEAPHQGEPVTLSWDPEHTFAVTPQDDLSLEEDDE